MAPHEAGPDSPVDAPRGTPRSMSALERQHLGFQPQILMRTSALATGIPRKRLETSWKRRPPCEAPWRVPEVPITGEEPRHN